MPHKSTRPTSRCLVTCNSAQVRFMKSSLMGGWTEISARSLTLCSVAQIDIRLRGCGDILVEPIRQLPSSISSTRRLRIYSDNIAQFGNALSYAIQTLPDMVIASAELDKITGIDLPFAISVKSLARKRLFYLLTSIFKAHAALRTTPGAMAS